MWENLGINSISTSPLCSQANQMGKPLRVWIKLNLNGSSLGNPGLAGGGCIFRNDDGGWILGFSRHIGITSSFMAEL